MNFNLVVECKTCRKDTDCRVGMSNRDVQPFRFCCSACGSPIDLTFYSDRGAEIQGGSIKQPSGRFNGSNPFVDLHLDFPVRYGHYIPGNTPFFAALDMVKADPGEKAAMLSLHLTRLEALNRLYPQAEKIRNLLRLYGDEKYTIFMELAEAHLQEKFRSLEPQDINACLYKLVSTSYAPFVPLGLVRDLVEGFTELTVELGSNYQAQFNEFILFLLNTGFMKKLQLDCLSLYPEILDAELALRPALFFDLIDADEQAQISGRVSTDKFSDYKDLLKDILEVLSRQFVIVAGINNLIKRGNFNEFDKPARKDLRKPSSLNDYADKPLGEKLQHLDDSWYNVDEDVIDNHLRNAVAHYKTEYDDILQIITYYPRREGVYRKNAEKIRFLAFMRKLLVSFREVHNLHHLVKCLFYYSYLIFPKTIAPSSAPSSADQDG